MSCNVILSSHFKTEAKRLIKKYVSLKSELKDLFCELEENPQKGILLGRPDCNRQLQNNEQGSQLQIAKRRVPLAALRATFSSLD
jgi:hypothetical protein